MRGLVDGVRHRVRTGCPWRDVPDRYGPWWWVYSLFARWQLRGTWHRMEAELRATADANGALSWQVSVDSTTARAHIHAAGGRRDSVERVAGEPDHHALGRSRGGWGTKTHLAVDQHRGVLAFRLTPGQDGDSPQMIPVLNDIAVTRNGPGRPRRRPVRVLADKAYSSRATRARRCLLPWSIACWQVATPRRSTRSQSCSCSRRMRSREAGPPSNAGTLLMNTAVTLVRS